MLFHSLIKKNCQGKNKENPRTSPLNQTKALIKLQAIIENFLILMQ